MSDTWTPSKPDYSQAWVHGWEYVSQEGSTFWKRLREERGWSREDVYEKTDGFISPPRSALIECDYGVDQPDRQELEYLAIIYETTPGALLDRCYIEEGKRLLGGDS